MHHIFSRYTERANQTSVSTVIQLFTIGSNECPATDIYTSIFTSPKTQLCFLGSVIFLKVKRTNYCAYSTKTYTKAKNPMK